MLAVATVPIARYNAAMLPRSWSWLVSLSMVCAVAAQQPALAPAAAAAAASPFAAAIAKAPPEQRAAMEWLVANLPADDAKSLSAEFLLAQVDLACRARAQVAWGKQLSDELFHQFVLPYAQANERREDWRSGFVAKFLPLVQDCRTPGEAALVLNQSIFKILGVHYSTQRRAADQCPSESIEQGKASCTGLSILLADACRACCVPARLVSVRWPDQSGNHTWVEVYDGTAWRFCGADEPDPQGLDRGWFTGAAQKCAAAEAPYRIYAVSFAKTGLEFAAGWTRGLRMHGIDVTERYVAKEQDPTKQDPSKQGQAQDPQAAADAAIEAQCARFFAAAPAEQAKMEFDRNLDAALATKDGDARLRRIAWSAFRKAEHKDLRADFAADRVRFGDKESPYVLKQVGTKPASGYGLVIAMHGGGGVPKQINDSQWQHMQIYYKDHPEAGGYLYCALRAPTDEWNGFYTDYMYPLIDRLILQFCVCADVDPDKVYAIGYSHGGYGAFSIGPKMPDRFAAVHASASAPNDGQTAAAGLHSLKFSFMVGGKDTAYGRRTRCEAFAAILDGLKQEHPGLYPTTFTLVENNGHTGLPDRDILPKLLAERRSVVGTQLYWQLTDGVIRDHYWLHIDRPEGGKRIDAALDGQKLQLSKIDIAGVEAWLDARLVDLTAPLSVVAFEQKTEVRLQPSLRVLCETMQQRGDPQRAASCRIMLR